ncbi:unnamed protein product [Pedinophyceae sp. YPF-701]|nr:unnamed protein product [Pedinophyceae sp. YPF-701]
MASEVTAAGPSDLREPLLPPENQAVEPRQSVQLMRPPAGEFDADREPAFSKGAPKQYFANERTFLRWIAQAVYLGSISAGLVGYAAYSHHKASDITRKNVWARGVSLATLGVSIVIIMYAARMFFLRDQAMARNVRSEKLFADYRGPGVFGATVIVTLMTMFLAAVAQMAKQV